MLEAYGNKKDHDLLSFFYQKIGTTEPSRALFEATISNSIGIFHLLRMEFGHQISRQKKLFLTQIAASRGYTSIFSEMIDEYFEELCQHKTEIFHTLSINQQDQFKAIFEKKEAQVNANRSPTLERLNEILLQHSENEPSDTLMMHLVIKSIQTSVEEIHMEFVPSNPVVKIEQLKTSSPLIPIEDIQRDLLGKARQIVGSSHSQKPETLMFYLAQRRIAKESEEYIHNAKEQVSQKPENSYSYTLHS
ncbi:MAG: hypothetical protein U1E78_06220 [Gammaproteobacteria bacterium]